MMRTLVSKTVLFRCKVLIKPSSHSSINKQINVKKRNCKCMKQNIYTLIKVLTYGQPGRGVHPSPLANDAYCIFSLFQQEILIFPIFYFFFLCTLTMMHLCIMRYTYWTPLLPGRKNSSVHRIRWRFPDAADFSGMLSIVGVLSLCT